MSQKNADKHLLLSGTHASISMRSPLLVRIRAPVRSYLGEQFNQQKPFNGFIAFLSSKLIRWQGASSGSSGCAPRGRDRSRTTDEESDNIDE